MQSNAESRGKPKVEIGAGRMCTQLRARKDTLLLISTFATVCLNFLLDDDRKCIKGLQLAARYPEPNLVLDEGLHRPFLSKPSETWFFPTHKACHGRSSIRIITTHSTMQPRCYSNRISCGALFARLTVAGSEICVDRGCMLGSWQKNSNLRAQRKPDKVRETAPP